MQAQSDYSMMPDSISPRPSPQHSKSLTAPLDCSNCLKQQSNPINNFISKWKYKEDLAKPLNMKRTRPRKQPQTTYHFPLSHCSVNTFNPNNKQNEPSSDSSSPVQESSPSPTESPQTPSPRQQELKEQEQPISPHSSPSSSPRLVTRDAFVKHRRSLVQQYVDLHPKKRPQGESEEAYDQTMQRGMEHETSPKRKQQGHHHSPTHDHDTSRFMLKKATRAQHSVSTPRLASLEISSICNSAAQDPMVSPHSSDNDEYSHIEGMKATSCSKKKRRSNGDVVMELDTIEISDDDDHEQYYHSENDDEFNYDSSSSSSSSFSPRYLSHSSFSPRDLPSTSFISPRDSYPSYSPRDPHATSYSPRDPAALSPRFPPAANVCMHPPRESPADHDNLSYSRQHHHLSLHGGYSDLAKYHLEYAGRSALPPLNLARLPSIDDLPWPMDDSNPRLHRLEAIHNHPRSQSFPSSSSCHY